MKVKIQYYGNFKKITQKDQETLECNDNISLLEMMSILTKTYKQDFQNMVFADKDQLKPALLVVVNNQTIDKTKEFTIKDGDEIKLLIAIAGG